MRPPWQPPVNFVEGSTTTGDTATAKPTFLFPPPQSPTFCAYVALLPVCFLVTIARGISSLLSFSPDGLTDPETALLIVIRNPNVIPDKVANGARQTNTC